MINIHGVLLFFGSPAIHLDCFGGPVALRRQVALALLLSEQRILIYDMEGETSRKKTAFRLPAANEVRN